MYNTKEIATFSCKQVSANHIPWFMWNFVGITLAFGCVSWNPWHVEQLFFLYFPCLFMFVQYIRSVTSIVVFYMVMWLQCSHSSILNCSGTSMMTVLPFMATPSIITSTSLNVHCGCVSCFTSFLINGHPSIMYALRLFKYISSSGAAWMSYCYAFWYVSFAIGGVDVYVSAISSSLFLV